MNQLSAIISNELDANISSRPYAVPYDTAANLEHKSAFVRLLLEQAEAHGEALSPGHAQVVANEISRQFSVQFICKTSRNSNDAFKSMVVTTRAYMAEGELENIEDLVTAESARRQKFASMLFFDRVIAAWNDGLNGLTWQTSDKNIGARDFYATIDPAFNFLSPHAAWRVSERQCAYLAKQSHVIVNAEGDQVRPADHDDLDPINSIIKDCPDMKIGKISKYVTDQQSQRSNNPLIVFTAPGSLFAIGSSAYSTFEGKMRTDIRLYLPLVYSPTQVKDLVQGVCREIAKRHWVGSVHFEFGDNVVGLSHQQILDQKARLLSAEEALRAAGAEHLIHDGARMLPWRLTGKRFAKAVETAVNNYPDRPLTSEAATRLSKSMCALAA